MSTFSLLLMLLFLIVFGIQFFMYFVNIDMPRFSGFLTLLLLLMVIMEIIIAAFELPAALIDGMVLICMGNRMIFVCCAAAVLLVLLFIAVKLLPKINWKKALTFTPIKYVVLGALVILLSIYTELFNGSYSFDSMEQYNAFKQEFAKYDRHFWPTKFIRGSNGVEHTTVYSIYPWDVEITDGRQVAYKVVTFYADDDSEYEYGTLCYYPFTYNLYAGASPMPVEYEKSAPAQDAASVSQSDTSPDTDGDADTADTSDDSGSFYDPSGDSEDD